MIKLKKSYIKEIERCENIFSKRLEVIKDILDTLYDFKLCIDDLDEVQKDDIKITVKQLNKLATKLDKDIYDQSDDLCVVIDVLDDVLGRCRPQIRKAK